MPLRNTSLFCYAWDLAEKEMPEITEKLHEWRINSVTLAGSYHAGKFIRPHGVQGKVYFPEDGTSYFNTTAKLYGSIKPVVNTLAASHDVFDACCQQKDIGVTAWMVLLHNSRLGKAHPEASVTNAFGDRYVYSLCPSCPDVREYAIALCRDIAGQYPIQGMTLESPGFLPFVHGYHHEFALVRQNAWLNNYLGLCFCQHCCKRSAKQGVDSEGLKDRVQQRINTYLTSDADYPPDMADMFWSADLVTDPDLVPFLNFRCDVVQSLIADIKDSLRPDIFLSVIPSVTRPTSNSWMEGCDLRQLNDTADFLDVCFYESSVERIRSDLRDIEMRIGSTEKVRGILRPGYPDLRDKQSVIDAVSLLDENGVTDLSFYNYGHLRKYNLDWMGEALRLAGANQ